MEKKVIYLSTKTAEPFVPRYEHGTHDAPQMFSLKELLTGLTHDMMRGEVYDYEVRIAPGTYYLSSPVEFKTGCGAKITFMPDGEGEVILHGGKKIEGFTETTVNGAKALVADLPEVRLGEWYFEELYVNGAWRYRPALPKGGKKFRITNVPNHPVANFGSTDVHFFEAADGAFDKISHVEDTTVEILHYWLSERMPVTKYDKENKMVWFERMPRRPLIDDLEPYYAQYRILNVFEALTEPGEWYLDREAGKLYYIPLPGETADNILVEAPVLQNLVLINGTPEEAVGNVAFRGITFACTKSDTCDAGAAKKYATYGQAAKNRDGAIRMTYARDVSLENCTLWGCGNYAIEATKGCHNIVVEGCEIRETGAGGIKICGANSYENERDLSTKIRVEDCYIHDCTKIDYGAIGIFVSDAASVRLAHNEICRLKYSGISVGWVWGMHPSRTQDAIIEYNHIHHCGDGDMSDMGGIYLLGPQRGTEIRGNYIHDIHRANYGGWGIYLDEGSTNILVEKNIVYDCDTSGFMIHYGTENIVRYNIFGHGDANFCIGARTAGTYATMMKNIFFVEDNPWFSGGYNADPDRPLFVSDLNFFYKTTDKPLHNQHETHTAAGILDKPWDAWLASGNDTCSKTFSCKEKILKTPDEVKKYGFPEIDARDAGVRK